MTGLSFLGARLPNESLSCISQCGFILLNIAVIAFSYYTFFISVVHNRAEPGLVNEFENSTVNVFLGDPKSLTPLIVYLRISSLAIYHLFSYLINLYLGAIAKPFLAILATDVLPRLNPKVEKQIGLKITVVEVSFIGLMIFFMQGLVFIKFARFNPIRSVEIALNMFSLCAPIALIAYLNSSVAHLIMTNTKNNKNNLSVSRINALSV